MITLPELYQHQEEHKQRVRASLANHGRVIMNAPTGCGKTRMSKWILGSSLNRTPSEKQSGFSLFTVHRRGLVDNAVESFAEDPALPHGLIMSGREAEYGRRVQVASIDTLLSWFVDGEKYRPKITFDLIVWDECHSHHSKMATFLKYHDAKREELGLLPAFLVGLTATPQAKGLADVYKEIVKGPATQWLIDNKYLSPFRYFRATQGQLDKLVKRGGEFTKESECDAMEGLAGDLVRDWKQFADGRPTVGFFPRITHAQDAVEKLEQAGVRVGYVDGNTHDDERRSLFRALNNHHIDYLCNVQVIERGTDIPRIGCVQLCVAIGGITRYRQMIGRGSRVHPEKTDCIVLDHGGNIKRHGFFEDDPDWTLDVSTKKTKDAGTRATIECPRCQAVYRGGKCRHCGYEPTPKERKSQGLQFDGSELKEVTKGEKATKKKTCEQIMITALYQAGRRNGTWKQALAIAYGAAGKQGTQFRVPSRFSVGGHTYQAIPFGSGDSSRRVSILYPFTVGKHGGDYLVRSEKRVDVLF